jgi:hypothetical protein
MAYGVWGMGYGVSGAVSSCDAYRPACSLSKSRRPRGGGA